MPSGSGASSEASEKPASDTPALAKPKIGTMAKATQGWMACSSVCSGE